MQGLGTAAWKAIGICVGAGEAWATSGPGTAAAVRHAKADRAIRPTLVPAEVNDGLTTSRLPRVRLSMFSSPFSACLGLRLTRPSGDRRTIAGAGRHARLVGSVAGHGAAAQGAGQALKSSTALSVSRRWPSPKVTVPTSL